MCHCNRRLRYVLQITTGRELSVFGQQAKRPTPVGKLSLAEDVQEGSPGLFSFAALQPHPHVAALGRLKLRLTDVKQLRVA